MIEEKYNKLKNNSLKKALYLSGTTMVLIILVFIFIFVVKIIPLAIVLAVVGIINWMYGSYIFHNSFMRLQQDIMDEAFKTYLPGFSVNIGGIPKIDLLKKLKIDYAFPTYLPSFVIKGEYNGVKVYSYSASYKQGAEDDFTYARLYEFSFPTKPYQIKLDQFDSSVAICSNNTEIDYHQNDIDIHVGSYSKDAGNIYSLFLNKYNSLDEYIKRIKDELEFIKEVIDVAKK